MRFTLSPDVCLRQERVRDGTRLVSREGLIIMDEPICHSGKVEQYIDGLCVRCHGETLPWELLGRVAAALGIEELLGRGVLIPES